MDSNNTGTNMSRYRIELVSGNEMAWDSMARRFRKLDSGQYTKYKTVGSAERAALPLLHYGVRVAADRHFWNAAK